MEAGNLLRSIPLNPNRHSGRRLPFPRRFIRVCSNLKGGYRGPRPKRELLAEWVSNNDDAVRSLPIYVGGVSLLAVLFNRTVSGIALVADAGSSQSRADLLTLGLAVTNILAGLVWLSIRPKTISVVEPQGVQCERMHDDLPDFVASELLWAWESLLAVTCCRSLVIVYDNKCMYQIGCAAASFTNEGEPIPVDATKLMQGSLYQGVIKSGSQSYLANLSLYPGKSQLQFLPSNTQRKLGYSFWDGGSIGFVHGEVVMLLGLGHKCIMPRAVILQPLGDKGIAIIGGNTIRGFTTSDQAWISLIGEKLDATLSKNVDSLTTGKFKIETVTN